MNGGVATAGAPPATSAPWRAVGWLLFALVPAALLFAALAPEAWVVGAAEGGIACPFRTITGIVCPFCNMTHATLALGQGDLAASLGHHALGPLVLAMWMWASSELGRRQPSRLIRHRHAPLAIGGVVLVIWAVNLAG